MEKQIPDFPEYLATDEGVIISLKNNKRTILVGSGAAGYWGVLLRRNGKTIRRNVHRLIAATFLGLPDKVGEVNHKDGDKLNNHLDNLEITTRSENMKHAYLNGLWGNQYTGRAI